MKRLILSILAGFLITAILSVATDAIMHGLGIFPPADQPFMNDGLLLLAFTYRAIYGVLGAYITAMIAKERAKNAILILGIIGTVLWLAGSIAMWEMARPWYNIAGIITALPLTLLGGKLYAMRSVAKLSRDNNSRFL